MRMMFALLGAAVLLAATSTGVLAQAPTVDLSPYPSYYGGETLEVPPGDVEPLFIHFDLEGLWHIGAIEVKSVVQGVGSVAAGPWIDLDVSQYPEPSVWYHLCDITVNGEPSTIIDISVDITFQLPTGTVSSNSIRKHITPEPSSLLALGTGALGIGGLLLRRRR